MSPSYDQNRPGQRVRAPHLGTAFIASSLIFGLIAALVILGPITRYGRAFQSEVQTDNAMRGARALEVALGRAIEREWDSLVAVAGNADPGDLESIRGYANAVLRAGGRIAWAGFADRGGTIRAGAQGTREGEDVGTRRWFREGLNGGSVGSVYLSPERRAGSDSDDEALVNLSTPVTNAVGQSVGVFVYSLRMPWVDTYLKMAAEELELDAFILDREGKVIAERRAEGAPELAPEAIRSFQLNRPHTEVLSGADDRDEVYAIIPNMTATQMPPMNWSVVVRLPALAPGSAARSLSIAVLSSLIALFALLAVFVLIFNRHFLTPISRLADISDDVADGHEIYPEEFGSSHESTRLSHALSRIQAKLQ
ncbi:hypothetical protein GCM10011534_18810 [Pseudooceanicola nanhaiensis]|uniref:Cache domain-containing protein n=1 Tax=Pseudooceanicola nanhaiensis TaxID=375761 RepID=A0A917SUQ9_9RHOB|nr:cache domain-containing protein [Pseudooceanicola nanhaiensis]GGL97054.1 hypothetical protein GCM10011534_18810 [Pseudooceanicola nanhaiensis]